MLAFEVYQPAIARILGALGREQIDNVRLIEADAVAGLRHLVGADSVDELWTFFPDPWPKARHQKRRLLSPDFVDLAVSRLKPGGRWRLATDWENYAGRMRDLLDDHPRLVNDHDQGWAPRWSARPVTRFEARGIEAGPTDLRPELFPCPLTRTRWRLDIGYDGTNFAGWAVQTGQRTVQGELELWITRLLRLDEPVRLVCAGRTDAGVHARGQVAHGDLDSSMITDGGDGTGPAAAPGAG